MGYPDAGYNQPDKLSDSLCILYKGWGQWPGKMSLHQRRLRRLDKLTHSSCNPYRHQPQLPAP